MNKIVSKEHFSANVVKLEVEAPLIARSRKAGHFVIVKVGEKGERNYHTRDPGCRRFVKKDMRTECR